jgi:glycosyltransferase involved in cell wall biosynthesis
LAKYSIIIATHARPKLLERALKSVKSQIIPDVQVIVVSDERSAELYAAARQYLSGTDIFIERGSAPGPAHSRTVGMSVASGDWIAFLDDEFSTGFMAGIEPYAAASSETILFCDYVVVVDGEDRLIQAAASPVHLSTAAPDPLSIYVQNFIPNSCLLYLAAVVRNKAFDEALALNEDGDFPLNAVESVGDTSILLSTFPWWVRSSTRPTVPEQTAGGR